MNSTEKLQHIVEKLRDEETRWDAIMQLRDLNEDGLAHEILPYLCDPDWVVRWIMAEKCGEIGDQFSAIELVTLLKDRDFHVRQNAFKALKRLRKKAVPALAANLVHRDPEIRKKRRQF